MSITEQLEDIKTEICDQICRHPHEHEPEEWDVLMFSDESPCNNCPLNKH